MRKVRRYLFDENEVVLFVGKIRQHYDGQSTDSLKEAYSFLWDYVFDNGGKMDPITRKMYEIEWQVIRSVLRGRGVIA